LGVSTRKVQMRGKYKLEILSIMAFVAVTSCCICAQQPDFSSLTHGGPFESVEQRLKKHDVPLNKTGLLRALHGSDSEVKWLAASELIHLNGKDAVPDVVQALDAEEDPMARVLIANVLAQAQEPQGLAALKGMCNDAAVAGYWRMEAAEDLLNLDHQECLNSVADVLQATAQDANTEITLRHALTLLPRFRNLSAEDSEKLLTRRGMLVNSDSLIRATAGRALGDFGNSAAIPYLDRTIAAEANRDTSTELKAGLERLKTKE